MGRLELAVDEGVAELLHQAGKHDECYLRGTGDEREHAFAKEAAAQGDAVESAHERSVLPYLDTHGIALVVQSGVGFLHLGTEPGAQSFLTQRAALVDDLLEGSIDGDAQFPTLDLVEFLVIYIR